MNIETRDKTGGAPFRIGRRAVMSAAALVALAISLPVAWPRLPVIGIYVLFGSALAGIGAFLLANTRRTVLHAMLLVVGAAGVAIAFAFLVRGELAILVLVNGVKSQDDLQKFAYTGPGLALTVVGFVGFCGLLAGACRAVSVGNWFIGGFSIAFLLFWAYCWHGMTDEFQLHSHF